MNALIIARIAVSIIGALGFIVNGMYIQEGKDTEAIFPFVVGVICSIGIWFIQ
jgi:hypothetical protein